MQDQILDMLLKKDEITWQSILYDLVNSEQMDPWDIDISLLSQRYLETIKKFQETNFFISGKVILASAILLKIKSEKLLDERLARFDSILFNQPLDDLELMQEFEEKNQRIKLMENPRLTVKTPLARKRKVSLNDLISALEKALEVDKRRTLRNMALMSVPENIKIPEKKFDITEKIKEIYDKIKHLFTTKKTGKITFTELVPSNKKEDKVYTFIPLLHLANQEKIDLNQEIPFGEIQINILK
ncbi:segregation/condensation protein A [Candidatus Woesearchaeota archaeon]|nr:segregation/condensation protein A [Candidatus Woesearchaeota archaeon]